MEFRMKQGILKDILAHYKHTFNDDYLRMAHSDVRAFVQDNQIACRPCKAEVDFISRPFLRAFTHSHDLIGQMSICIASLNYEDAVECYCKLCLCD